jgi:hypothetical protein
MDISGVDQEIPHLKLNGMGVKLRTCEPLPFTRPLPKRRSDEARFIASTLRRFRVRYEAKNFTLKFPNQSKVVAMRRLPLLEY